MSVKEAPLAQVKRLHGSKEKLVDATVEILGKEEDSDESSAELKVRLMAASNKKLLRLHGSLVTLKEKYGSKEKLVESLSEAQGKSKDEDYKAKLHTYSIHQLLDMMNAASRKARSSRKAS